MKLLEESLKNPKKWYLISKKFLGRTQHNVKNRFILLMSRENSISRTETRKIMKRHDLVNQIKTTLKKLDENNQSGEASMMEINENVEILSEGSFVQAANYLFGENNEYEEKYLRSFLKIDDKIDL